MSQEITNWTDFFNKYTSLEGLASRYPSLTRVFYILSLLGVLAGAIIFLVASSRWIGGLEIFLFLLILFGGYIVVTFVFGFNALIIQIHKNLKKLAEK